MHVTPRALQAAAQPAEQLALRVAAARAAALRVALRLGPLSGRSVRPKAKTELFYRIYDFLLNFHY